MLLEGLPIRFDSIRGSIVYAVRRLLWATLVFALISAIPEADAKLGESQRQCVKRYGKPTGTIHVPGWVVNGIGFYRGEYAITCGFEDDICVMMVVMRLTTKSATPQPIPREDMLTFMEENFGTTSWAYTRIDDSGTVWRTHDFFMHQSYVASYVPHLRTLTMSIDHG